MKKILFPFVLGQENKDAFVYAVKIARNMGAELIMLNTFLFEVDSSITKEKYKTLTKERWLLAYKEVAKLHNHYLANFAILEGDFKVKLDYRFIYGRLLNETIDIVKSKEIDLIVLSVLDNKINDKILISDFINKISKVDPVSVFIVPRDKAFREINQIIYATDFHKLMDGAGILNKVIKLAASFNATIHFVNVTKENITKKIDNKGTYEIIEKLTKHDTHVFQTLRGGDILKTINQYVSDKNINVVTVVKQHRSFIENIFHDSISAKIAYQSNIPILILMDSQ